MCFIVSFEAFIVAAIDCIGNNVLVYIHILCIILHNIAPGMRLAISMRLEQLVFFVILTLMNANIYLSRL